jgi:hypothetical protein
LRSVDGTVSEIAQPQRSRFRSKGATDH